MKEDEYQEPEQDPEDLDEDEDGTPATPEEMKAEAVERMKLLKIYPETIKQFENEGLVSIAEPPLGAHYWASEELQSVIDQFEKRYNALVFYGIKTIYEEAGTMYSLFYVCKTKDEWTLDRDDIEAGQSCVYVYVANDPYMSEIGAIGFTHTPAGGLRRTW